MKKITLRYILPLLFTVLILYIFLLRKTPPADIFAAFSKLSGMTLLVFAGLTLLATVLRAWRYRILLDGRLSFGDLLLITLVRNFSVDLLPARSAALLLYSYFTRKKGIKLEEGASSFVISMFYDTLALGLMLSGLLLFAAGTLKAGVYIPAAFLILALSGAVIFLSLPALKLLNRLPWLQKRKKPRDILQAVTDYLQKRRTSGERWLVFGLSLVIRALKYVSLFLLFRNLVPVEFNLEAFSDFTFGLAATELSALIPIQGLAGIGTWETVFSLVFSHIAPPLENPFLVGLVIHLTTQVWEYSLGIAAFLYLSFQKKKEIGLS